MKKEMKPKTRRQLLESVLEGDYDSQYAEFIMDNAKGDQIVCDGDQLLALMESGYMFDEFMDRMSTELNLK